MKTKNLKRSCKQLVCLLMAAMICLSIAPLSLAEQPEKGQQIDTVIVLDNSTSMRTRIDGAWTGNDLQGYRIDAAQMFISMCDMNGSRVAIIPFSEVVHESAINEFHVLDSENTRDFLIAETDKLRNYTQPNTNLGAALSVAVQILDNRTDKSNKPMILVLTDGKNSISIANGKKKVLTSPVWNEETGTFVEEKREFRDSDDAAAYSDEICEKAVDAACALGIPIYTVPLSEYDFSDPRAKGLLDVLQRMSNRTNGLCIPLNADSVDRLPEKFGEMLAERLGSSLVVELNPQLVEGTTDMYEVKIPMLNNSVMEANVYIPVVEESAKKGIRASQIWLYDPNNTDVSSGNGTSVTCTESEGHFRLYKLRQPIPTGEWRLQFRIQGNVDPNSIAFSVLYNYDVTLRTKIGTTPSNLTDGDGVYSKKETLLVQTQFYSNNENKPSTDSMLYRQVEEGDSWYTVKAHYALRDINGRVLFEGDIPSDNTSKFSSKIDLATVYVDDKGNSKLPSGKYELYVTVEGAGISRETSQWIELTNNAVTCNSALSFSAVVDDPQKPETSEPMLLSFNIGKYFNDADGDPISYTLTAVNDNGNMRTEDILPLSLVEKPDGMYVEGNTIKDSDGHIHFGTAKYEVTASDGETDITIPLEVVVHNKTYSDTSNFSCNVEVTGVDDQGIAQKNSDVTFTMSLVDKAGKADTTGSIELYSCDVAIYNANNTSELFNGGKVAMTPGANNTLTYTYQLDDQAHDYKAECFFYYNGKPCGSTEISFQVTNTAPSVAADAAEELPNKLSYQSKPFPPVLQHVTTDEELTINLQDLFTETDNENLVIYDPVFTCINPEQKPEDIISFDRDGDQVKLNLLSEGKVTMSVTAEDGDGTKAVFTKDHSLIDMTKRWTIYWGIAVAALTALILFVRAFIYATKTPYDGRVAIEIYEGSALGSSATYKLPTGKKRKKVASLKAVMDPMIAQKYGIDVAKLEAVKIAPHQHSRDGSVDVWQNGPVNGVEIAINGDPLSKKKKVWTSGGQITLRSLASNATIRLVHSLEDNELEFISGNNVGSFASGGEGDPFGGNFGGNNSFGGDDSFGGNNSFGGNDSFGGSDSFGSNDSFSGGGNSSSNDDPFAGFGDFGA